MNRPWEAWSVLLQGEHDMSNSNKSHDDKTFTVTVDGEPVEIPRKDVTPRVILVAAGLDPSTRYLIEKHGSNTISYKDKPDQELNVHENQTFLTGRCGPVTVS